MHTSLSFFSGFGGCRSSLLRLQFVREADCREEATLLLMLSLVYSGGSLSLVRTASTLDTTSLVGIRFGAIIITWLWRWLRWGCWKVSHHQQYFSGLLSPRRLNSIEVCNFCVQTIFYFNTWVNYNSIYPLPCSLGALLNVYCPGWKPTQPNIDHIVDSWLFIFIYLSIIWQLSHFCSNLLGGKCHYWFTFLQCFFYSLVNVSLVHQCHWQCGKW